MPLQQTSGNVTSDAYGGGVAAVPNYIESVFLTYLYTGNGGSLTNSTGIDLSTYGGMLWIKSRNNAYNNLLYDSNRGFGKPLVSNATNAEATYTTGWNPTFLTNGFSYSAGGTNTPNTSGATYASWTFRKQPKFFDVVTYTGDGNTTKDISHSLGSKPGWIILKKTSSTSNWATLANPTGNGSTQYYLRLNTTDSRVFTDSAAGNTSTSFRVTQYGDAVTGNSADNMNDSGDTYVAYLFAHNAGGFGLTGTDNVISCGSFTTDASGNATVNLGYEPQFCITKNISSAEDWITLDTMRGWNQSQAIALFPDLANAEVSLGSGAPPYDTPTATGFNVKGRTASKTFIYIAIRRGPMKVPTDATKVFSPVAAAFNSTTVNNNGFVTDMVITRQSRVAATDYQYLVDRLRGANNSSGQYLLEVDGTYAEAASSGRTALTGTQTIQTGFLYQTNTTNSIAWSFGRAPSFFDEVCYTGTGGATTVTHNLNAVPELIIVKGRSQSGYNWVVYSASLSITQFLLLSATNAAGTYSLTWNNTPPTSTVFSLNNFGGTNDSGQTYVAYLFASCPGVSKVGSYTGNGSTQTINCGFTGGARFVLIKRTDAAGDWYVYDTARGMTTLTDPYLLLNSTAAETATLGSVTTVTTGFAVNASILAAINTNAASYIFFAVA